jgi:geranylgeranyl diphosphate synthase type II
MNPQMKPMSVESSPVKHLPATPPSVTARFSQTGPRMGAGPVASAGSIATSGPATVSRPGGFGLRSRAPVDDFALFRVMIEQRLRETLPQETAHGARLVRAMRHATLSPGKRIRPLLVVLTARQCGGPVSAALDMGCALEFMHCASLILDDLPAMDDAQLRRGQPVTHRLFGEDIAILAAVGLLNQAYGLVAESTAIPDLLRLPLTSLLARTIGPGGLISGQEADLHDRAAVADFETVNAFNRLKTGLLIEASVQAGAMIAGAGPTSRQALAVFARQLGEAFQLIDDILDGSGSMETLGKDVGQDQVKGHGGLPAFEGAGERDAALALVHRGIAAACSALAQAPCGPEPLAAYARSILAEGLAKRVEAAESAGQDSTPMAVDAGEP